MTSASISVAAPVAADSLAAPAFDEPALVQAAANGDTRAFEALVRQHQQRVFNFLYHLTRHRQDAEDLAQQTFVKAYHHLAGFDCTRPLINWLLTIARRNALNHFRSNKRWEELPVEPVGCGLSPAQEFEQRERSEHLWQRARRILSRREFEAVWLRCGEQLSVNETAQVMGLSSIHIKVLVHRARQQLLKGAKS